MKKGFICLAAFFALAAVRLPAQGLCPAGDPDVELAKLWWPDQRNVWTPIG